jgi:hypothetical protein
LNLEFGIAAPPRRSTSCRDVVVPRRFLEAQVLNLESGIGNPKFGIAAPPRRSTSCRDVVVPRRILEAQVLNLESGIWK